MKTILIFAHVLLAAAYILGGPPEGSTKWELRAQELRRSGIGNCLSRSKLMAAEMRFEGVEYKWWFHWAEKGEEFGHCCLTVDGIIIDPAMPVGSHKLHYKILESLKKEK